MLIPMESRIYNRVPLSINSIRISISPSLRDFWVWAFLGGLELIPSVHDLKSGRRTSPDSIRKGSAPPPSLLQ